MGRELALVEHLLVDGTAKMLVVELYFRRQ
jgi:hypothetical protein